LSYVAAGPVTDDRGHLAKIVVHSESRYAHDADDASTALDAVADGRLQARLSFQPLQDGIKDPTQLGIHRFIGGGGGSGS